MNVTRLFRFWTEQPTEAMRLGESAPSAPKATTLIPRGGCGVRADPPRLLVPQPLSVERETRFAAASQHTTDRHEPRARAELCIHRARGYDSHESVFNRRAGCNFAIFIHSITTLTAPNVTQDLWGSNSYQDVFASPPCPAGFSRGWNACADAPSCVRTIGCIVSAASPGPVK